MASRMIGRTTVFPAMLLAILLLGCGGSGKEAKAVTGASAAERRASKFPCTPPGKRLKMTLDGRVGPENVGVLMAKRKGYFAKAGIHIWIGGPGRVNAPVRYVAEGLDFGIAQMPQVVIGRDRGLGVTAVGSILARPTASLIWLKSSKIGGVSDLKGKTIAVPGVLFQVPLLEAALARAGLTLKDVTLRQVGHELVPALLSGKADAIFGGSPNIEGVDLRSKGAKPIVIGPQALGLPPYEEYVLIAKGNCASKYPRLVRKFLAAVAHGTEAAKQDPAAASKLIEESVERDPDATPRAIEAEVRATLPLLAPVARMDASRASRLAEWMHEEGAILTKPQVAELLTNRFVPAS